MVIRIISCSTKRYIFFCHFSPFAFIPVIVTSIWFETNIIIYIYIYFFFLLFQ